MPTTNYATMNGELIGETGSNGPVYYHTDALGSVTMTTDENSNVLNEYRYAPYGTQISKTGTAPDPKYLWVGTQGYRATSRVHSEYYTRARHYGQAEGSWTTVDLLWPRECAYDYGRSRPTSSVDASGLSVSFVRKPEWDAEPNCCSDISLTWTLKIKYSNEPPAKNGFVIQHIVRRVTAAYCDGVPIVPPCPDYYEAFKLDSNGQPESSPFPFDYWQLGELGCSHGNAVFVGDLMVVRSINPNYTNCGGTSQYTWTDFPGFVAQPGGHASMNFSWGCCCPGANQPSCSCAGGCKPGPCLQSRVSCYPAC